MAKRDVRHADADLYERDYYAWVQRQLELLRTRRLQDVDLDNLIEEVEDLGKSELHAVESFVETIFEHLLELTCSPAEQPRHGWAVAVRKQRGQLHKRLTPTLRRHVEQTVDRLYAEARDVAVLEPPATGSRRTGYRFPAPTPSTRSSTSTGYPRTSTASTTRAGAPPRCC
jgi:hypothetical protein